MVWRDQLAIAVFDETTVHRMLNQSLNLGNGAARLRTNPDRRCHWFVLLSPRLNRRNSTAAAAECDFYFLRRGVQLAVRLDDGDDVACFGHFQPAADRRQRSFGEVI